jgi:hypothetical protein
VEIERLKTSLQMVAIEHQIRFSKLHEKRAEVIAELYKRLVDVYLHGRQFVLTSENNPTPQQQAEFDKTGREVFDLSIFIEKHRIYLSDSVCALLDKFVSDAGKSVNAAGIFGRFKNPTEHTLLQSYAAFTKVYDDFGKAIPEARRVLEIEFRKMLGVEQDAQA